MCLRSTFRYLHMPLQHWTKVEIVGEKPAGRTYAASCCIAGPLTGQQHPLLMVVGGYLGATLGDVWLLDVDKGLWVR